MFSDDIVTFFTKASASRIAGPSDREVIRETAPMRRVHPGEGQEADLATSHGQVRRLVRTVTCFIT